MKEFFKGVISGLVIFCVFMVVLEQVAVRSQDTNENRPLWDMEQVNDWCGDTGTVRMVGAVKHGAGVLLDETGNLWGWDDSEGGLKDGAFYLVWINDNGTPDMVEDDLIVKLWEEVA